MACRDCVWWQRQDRLSGIGTCFWPSVQALPVSVQFIKKQQMRDDDGTDCPAFNPREGE